MGKVKEVEGIDLSSVVYGFDEGGEDSIVKINEGSGVGSVGIDEESFKFVFSEKSEWFYWVKNWNNWDEEMNKMWEELCKSNW
jgi:hypothetical protein